MLRGKRKEQKNCARTGGNQEFWGEKEKDATRSCCHREKTTTTDEGKGTYDAAPGEGQNEKKKEKRNLHSRGEGRVREKLHDYWEKHIGIRMTDGVACCATSGAGIAFEKRIAKNGEW